MCTLVLPCSHFFRAESMQKYLDRVKRQREGNRVPTSGDSVGADGGVSSGGNPNSKLAKAKLAKRNILEEAHIGDRHTDRSVVVSKLYRSREIALEKEALRLQIQAEEEEEREEVKRLAIEEGTWQVWSRRTDEYGTTLHVNNETGEIWAEHSGNQTNALLA